MQTIQELRQLSNGEIQEELKKSSRELMKARLEHATGTLKETHKLKSLRRYIAQLKTILTETAKK